MEEQVSGFGFQVSGRKSRVSLPIVDWGTPIEKARRQLAPRHAASASRRCEVDQGKINKKNLLKE
jgi:hypothetical protein